MRQWVILSNILIPHHPHPCHPNYPHTHHLHPHDQHCHPHHQPPGLLSLLARTTILIITIIIIIIKAATIIFTTTIIIFTVVITIFIVILITNLQVSGLCSLLSEPNLCGVHETKWQHASCNEGSKKENPVHCSFKGGHF